MDPYRRAQLTTKTKPLLGPQNPPFVTTIQYFPNGLTRNLIFALHV